MKNLAGIQGRLNVTGEEIAPVSSLLPPAGSGRFTLTCIDGGHFESRRDSGWGRRGGLSPGRRHLARRNGFSRKRDAEGKHFREDLSLQNVRFRTTC
jgi:hypothetical protein